MKKQGVAGGAIILTLSGIIVKILGALFKIPLGAWLQAEGNGIFSVAYNIYALLFVVATAGIPVAMSKIVAEAEAVGENPRGILKKALPIMGISGLVLSVLLFTCSDFFASLAGTKSAAAAIRIISPAIFFVSIASVLRGYHQGRGNMIPTAISQMIEAAAKLVFGLAAVKILITLGKTADSLAAGAVVGVTFGALFSAVYLLFCKKGQKTGEKQKGKATLAHLFKTALPITLSSAIVSLTGVIDSGLIIKLLTESGMAEKSAVWLFGTYNYATTVFNLPGVLITTIGVSLVPEITKCGVMGEYKKLSKTAESALVFSMSITFAAAGGFLALGEPIMGFIYSGVEKASLALAGRMLSVLAAALPPLALSTLTASLLQGMGEVKIPMYSVSVAAAVKVFLNYLFIGYCGMGIMGACFSTIISYAIICVINVCVIARKREISLNFLKILLPSILTSALVAFAAGRIYYFVLPAVGKSMGLVITLISCVLLWMICILLVNKRVLGTKYTKKYHYFFNK